MLDGEIRIITQGNIIFYNLGGLRAKKDEKIKNYDESHSPLEMMLSTPVKENNRMREDKNEYLGSTSLRKTVFKNHYA